MVIGISVWILTWTLKTTFFILSWNNRMRSLCIDNSNKKFRHIDLCCLQPKQFSSRKQSIVRCSFMIELFYHFYCSILEIFETEFHIPSACKTKILLSTNLIWRFISGFCSVDSLKCFFGYENLKRPYNSLWSGSI